MKAYLWDSDQTLRNYRGGVVLILADSVEDAWAKLKIANPGAWVKLRCGQGYDGCADSLGKDAQPTPDETLAEYIEEMAPRLPLIDEPKEYELVDPPPVILWGGE